MHKNMNKKFTKSQIKMRNIAMKLIYVWDELGIGQKPSTPTLDQYRARRKRNNLRPFRGNKRIAGRLCRFSQKQNTAMGGPQILNTGI